MITYTTSYSFIVTAKSGVVCCKGQLLLWNIILICFFKFTKYRLIHKLRYLTILHIWCIHLFLLNLFNILPIVLNNRKVNTIVTFDMKSHVNAYVLNIYRHNNIKCHSAVIGVVEHINVSSFKEYKSQESKAHFLSERLNINHVRGTRTLQWRQPAFILREELK